MSEEVTVEVIRKIGNRHFRNDGEARHAAATAGCPWCVSDEREEVVAGILERMNPDEYHLLVSHTPRMIVAALDLHERVGDSE